MKQSRASLGGQGWRAAPDSRWTRFLLPLMRSEEAPRAPGSGGAAVRTGVCFRGVMTSLDLDAWAGSYGCTLASQRPCLDR